MGDGKSRLNGAEDLDLQTPFFVTQTRERDDVLPMADVQVGAEWRTVERPIGQLLVRGAFEGQWWGGVGSAASEEGGLGFLGFSAGVGLVR